jgi:glycosyltransferase involved in cell wall biosynthesis
MNILIDASQIPLEKTGVGVYADNLIHAILETDPRNRYTIVIQDDEKTFADVVQRNIRIVKYPARIFRKLLFRFILEQIFIPLLSLKLKIDVIHSLHYSFPLVAFGRKRVVTIHDMTFFKYPQVHEPCKIFYFRFFILMAARLASRTIVDSESTHRDFIARTDANPETVTTVLPGRPPTFDRPSAAPQAVITRERFGICGDYILFVGTLEPRKNLFRLILAFARLVTEGIPVQLLALGKKGWGYDPVYRLIEDLGIGNRIVFTGYVDEDEKRHLMKHAKVFVYPSLYEGFGLPLLEALALGLPSVTSNVSSLPEVAGSAAILVDPNDIEAIYRAIRRVLTDEKLRGELSAAARKQARRFSWRTAAKKTIEVYETTGA